jgi:hypothetical protein
MKAPASLSHCWAELVLCGATALTRLLTSAEKPSLLDRVTVKDEA